MRCQQIGHGSACTLLMADNDNDYRRSEWIAVDISVWRLKHASERFYILRSRISEVSMLN